MSNKQLEQRFLEQLNRLQKRKTSNIIRRKKILKRVIYLAKELDSKNDNTNSIDLVKSLYKELI